MRRQTARSWLLAFIAAVIVILIFHHLTAESKGSDPVSPTDHTPRLNGDDTQSERGENLLGIPSKVPIQLKSWTIDRDPNFDYKAEMKRLNEQKASMDDPMLIKIIRNYYIDPPSEHSYNLKYPQRIDPSRGQAPYIDSRLHYKTGGFYVECGALDGEKGSNTLFFERHRGWNGVLIEANPSNYEMLMSKHRKAFSINACLSLKPYPQEVNFKANFNVGRVVQGRAAGDQIVRAQCFPLYSILLALNQTTVDFFSLDVEGDELAVLDTIPFSKVDIDMMAVEYAHNHGAGTIRAFGAKHGYISPITISREDWGANDVILRRKRNGPFYPNNYP